MTVAEVIYPPHAVRCNSISHLAWAEGDTQKSIPIAAPPKCMSNQELCSLTWTDFINLWVEVNQFRIDLSPAALSQVTPHCLYVLAVRTRLLLNESDLMTSHWSVKTLADYPPPPLPSPLSSSSSRPWAFFMPQVSWAGGEQERRDEQSAGGKKNKIK